jgi:hypothetical protein
VCCPLRASGLGRHLAALAARRPTVARRSRQEDLATLEGKVRASNNPLIGGSKRKCPRGVPLEKRPPFGLKRHPSLKILARK